MSEGPVNIPFNMMDEMFMHLDTPTHPLLVHLEVRVGGSLDEERLRGAVLAAIAHHPLARARLAPWRSDAKTYVWHVDDDVQLDPVRSMAAPEDESLDDLRSEIYSRAVTLYESPPFRVALVHDPGGDYVMLAANHAACDGIGALRLLQSVGRAYAGIADPTVDVDPAEAHRLALPAPEEGRGMGDRLDRARLNLRQLAQVRSRQEKVKAKDGSPEPGYCKYTMALPVAPLVASPLRRRLNATVNDVLLAAIHRSIAEWNRQQGGGKGRISVGIPVNARPEEWRYEFVGNLITNETVSTLDKQRETPESCLAAVAGWTEAVKRRGSGPAMTAQARGWPGRVSQRRAVTPVIRVMAGFASVTAALTNLGAIKPDWVASDAFAVREMWFSPPAFGSDLGIGAISVADTLHLGLCYVPALFSRDAAGEFAGLLRKELDALSAS